MMNAVDPRALRVAAAQEIENNSWLQAERHITASGFWGNFQWLAGGAAAFLAATASGLSFAHSPYVAGSFALASAGAAALVTALRPGDQSTQHLTTAADFQALQTQARAAWEFTPSDSEAPTPAQVQELRGRWSEIMKASPRISRRLIGITKARFIDKGANYYPRPEGQPFHDEQLEPP